MMSADCLVLLSDVDGFYTAPPGSREDARRLEEGREITPEIEAMAGGGGSGRCPRGAGGARGTAGPLEPKGSFVVDNGAAQALATGKSLLPAGVTRVEGGFERGDAVVIRNGDGVEIGRGLTAYGHEEAKAIIGRKGG